MAKSAEHRSKFAAFHRQWWRLQMSEKFSSGTITSEQRKNILNTYVKHVCERNMLNFCFIKRMFNVCLTWSTYVKHMLNI